MTLPLLLVLLCAAAGAAVGRLLRIPMWALSGALVGSATASALLSSPPPFPTVLTFGAQILVGTAVGAAVRPTFLAELRSLLLPAALVTAVVISIGLSAAALTIRLAVLDPQVATLGMIPGGVGEMVAASASLGADSAAVAGIHLVRLLVCLWVLPLLVRWAARNWRSPDH
jgi:uncharacterized protein